MEAPKRLWHHILKRYHEHKLEQDCVDDSNTVANAAAAANLLLQDAHSKTEASTYELQEKVQELKEELEINWIPMCHVPQHVCQPLNIFQ